MEPFEPPKYIASLIAAINDGAKSAQLGALALVAIGLFLLATAFSATDEDLLLNHSISISQLGGAQVPVTLSFGLAPAVFLATHLYTLLRYDMLAGNVRRFRVDLPAMVLLETDQERCRQLLANVEFVQALVMPKGSRSASPLFRFTAWFIIAAFPITVLLLVQLSSLRLQDIRVNVVHHICLLVDLALLVWFLRRRRAAMQREVRSARACRWLALLWAPVPVGAVDLSWLHVPAANDDTVQAWRASPRGMLRQPVDLLLCPYVRFGCQFLTVTYRPLVNKVWDAAAFVELRAGKDDEKHRASFEPANLRGRMLRFANLTGSEFYGADLAEAELEHARMSATKLQHAVLEIALLQGTALIGAQLQGANLNGAELQGADLSWAHLEGGILQ
jgi:hypothetical protein